MGQCKKQGRVVDHDSSHQTGEHEAYGAPQTKMSIGFTFSTGEVQSKTVEQWIHTDPAQGMGEGHKKEKQESCFRYGKCNTGEKRKYHYCCIGFLHGQIAMSNVVAK